MTLSLQQWTYTTEYNVILRGARSKPSGRPVLHFVHGNGYCGQVYEPFLSHFAPHFDLFLSDVQGHGDSDDGEHFWGWNENARITSEVWKHFRGEYEGVPVIAMGHSFGAVLTALVNARQEKLFDYNILLDPVFFSSFMLMGMKLSDRLGLLKNSSLVKRARNRGNLWTDKSAAWEYFYERGMFKGWSKESLQAYVNHALIEDAEGRLVLKCPPKREAEIFGSYPEHLWTALNKLSRPTLLFYGDSTYPFIEQSVRRLRMKNTYVMPEKVPGGHCFMQQVPKQTAHKVLKKLQSHSELLTGLAL